MKNHLRVGVGVIVCKKCEKWEWFNWSDLPEPLFLPIKNLLKQKFNPNI